MTEDISEEEIQAAIDEVYRGPLDGFVARRDALARRLRQARRRDDAEAVKRLRKPNRTAWALDATVHDDPTSAEPLVAAVDRVVEAQAGRGDLRSGLEGLRAALRDFAAAAARVAAVEGRTVGQAELVPAVAAVAGDAEALEALRRGTLAAIPTGGGLDLLAAIPFPVVDPPVEAEADAPEPVDGDRVIGGEAAAVEVARRALRQAEADAATARRRATEARTSLREAEANAELASERLRFAERAAGAAEATLEEARREADEADEQRDDRDRAVAEARTMLERLEESDG